LPPAASAVILFAGDAPHGISDHSSRTARELGGSVGWSMARLWNSKHFPLYSHTMLVVGPEHARPFAHGGWSKDDLKRHLNETVRRPYRTLLPDADRGQGTNLRFGKGESWWPAVTSGRFFGGDSWLARHDERFASVTRAV
jgi:hypothetical protein